jgi:hypothetical protein
LLERRRLLLLERRRLLLLERRRLLLLERRRLLLLERRRLLLGISSRPLGLPALTAQHYLVCTHSSLGGPRPSLGCPSLGCPSLGCPSLGCPSLGCPRLTSAATPCFTNSTNPYRRPPGAHAEPSQAAPRVLGWGCCTTRAWREAPREGAVRGAGGSQARGGTGSVEMQGKEKARRSNDADEVK